MPVFDTPKPITVSLDLPAAEVRITASERTDTVVDIRPSRPSDAVAAEAADGAHIAFADGMLTVTVPPQRRRGLLDMLRSGVVEVTIDLPEDSDVRGVVAGGLHASGRLGDCRLRTDWGGIRLAETAALHLTASSGEIDVDRTGGPTEITSQDGDIRVGRVEGSATVRNTNGEITVGEVTGHLRLIGVNGEIEVERALGDIEARTAHGGIRIGEVVRGTVSLTTAYGELDLGIRRGTAAWLDLDSAAGEVHNDLDAADGPGTSDETVEVRARTSGGDIHIHRS
ncbi:DUF4097 family beta strand repeat-containing protein [Pseudonocardia abyssalis]|uniref:DUF4097 family beta strand repeat protein n=1 Tax=Pseudonocardia abyssalis TaxID=2792008 RepID=A0ABS6UTR8_9PSEU|nr:DUF4097 family beta strand repeat-containing protein [Pseudonocardia abyssalis]MBW0115332.1 DUF4097 family beta strand repeat protein [Pseudonocardia abyssalis]MBW0135654.1 DUF4097 family beta strand repeat protein [Pseudonocardia abyssalis]